MIFVAVYSVYPPGTPKTDDRRRELRDRNASDPSIDVLGPAPVEVNEGGRPRSYPRLDSGLKMEGGGSTVLGHGVRVSGNDEGAKTRAVSADPHRTTRGKSQMATFIEPKKIS